MKSLKMGRKKTIYCLEEIIKNIKEDLKDTQNKHPFHPHSHYFTWCRFFPSTGKRGILIKIIK